MCHSALRMQFWSFASANNIKIKSNRLKRELCLTYLLTPLADCDLRLAVDRHRYEVLNSKLLFKLWLRCLNNGSQLATEICSIPRITHTGSWCGQCSVPQMSKSVVNNSGPQVEPASHKNSLLIGWATFALWLWSICSRLSLLIFQAPSLGNMPHQHLASAALRTSHMKERLVDNFLIEHVD